MAAHPLPLPYLTPEEYLRIERAAEFKSEYYQGQMFAMSGGRLAHALITLNIAVALAPLVKGRGCRSVNSDLRVQASPIGPYFYPDLTVFCGEAQLADQHQDMLLNPRVIFEVLSKSSEAYDRGVKFDEYRKIESLQEYVLVWQTEPRIEVWRRPVSGGGWIGAYCVGIDAICTLESLGCSISLSDIYSDIPLETN
jgi:Uma2 family endonuclease